MIRDNLYIVIAFLFTQKITYPEATSFYNRLLEPDSSLEDLFNSFPQTPNKSFNYTSKEELIILIESLYDIMESKQIEIKHETNNRLKNPARRT